MRALVEQTRLRIETAFANLARSSAFGRLELPCVQELLGGQVSTNWMEAPERRAIVLATQDLALSRQLNRGYAMSRFQWPMAFAATNNDVLNVVDEVQLHGVGATTAAQLQGLAERFGTFGMRKTVFMSATINTQLIDTVDYGYDARMKAGGAMALSDEDRADEKLARLLHASKTLIRVPVSGEAEAVDAIVAAHHANTLTLVVLNTVKRAKAVFAGLKKRALGVELLLMHSRFRAEDRARLAQRMSEIDSAPGSGAIVVATQVVEAGVDISAETLISDVAPWSSMVQRFGRCNRRGRQDAAARVIWLDDQTLKPAPYDSREIASARVLLASLEGESASPDRLSHVASPASATDGGAVLRSPDLLDLFDTTTDLSGNDVDVSRFIRDGDEISAFVFWRNVVPTRNDPPRRDELCPVARDDAYALLDKLASDRDYANLARVVNPLARDSANARPENRWQPARKPLRPGEVVWLSTTVGCYDAESGFDLAAYRKGDVTEIVHALDVELVPDESIDDDMPSFIGSPVTLDMHGADAREAAVALTDALEAQRPGLLGSTLKRGVVEAAYWHDVGKAHPVFQATMKRSLDRSGISYADEIWAKSVGGGKHERPHFRHELASALIWMHEHRDGSPGEVDLIAYLIAAHHGKLRMGAYTLAGESSSDGAKSVRSMLGMRDGEKIPGFTYGTHRIDDFVVDLHVFDVGCVDGSGIERVWNDRVLRLRDNAELGPFRLAYLETIVRLADWRASAKRQNLGARNAAPVEAEATVLEFTDFETDTVIAFEAEPIA